MTEYLTIGELARKTEVTTSTLRFYDELGIVEPARRVSGHRQYTEDAVEAVGVVKLLREAGFSLDEAKQFVTLNKPSPRLWRQLVLDKADELQRRIVTEQAALEALEHLLRCPARDALECANFQTIVATVSTAAGLAEVHSQVHGALSL